MKIRSITLHNVRKFQNTSATISNITDGITTICAPNESGKSTFFDALHALFFYPHGGQSQEIKSLQPYSKGPVHISVDVEDDNGHPWRIEKRYLSSKAAIITDLKTQHIHAQADEAEEWIRNLIGADMHGPTGLLWVRQGISGFGPDGSGTKERNEREKLRETRQGLMSSVAGQIDNVTGGRRMDLIMKSCISDLEALATKTGSPKAGGEWSKATKAVQELEATEARLADQVAELSDALKEHASLKQVLASPEYQKLSAERDAAIQEARAKLEAAISHEAEINATQRDLKLSELEAQAHKDRISTSEAAASLQKELKKNKEDTSSATKQAEKNAQDILEKLKQVTQEYDEAQTLLRQARKDLASAHTRQEAIRAIQRRADINDVLNKISEHEAVRSQNAAIVRNIQITAEQLSRLETLTHDLSAAKAARDASAASINVTYSGKERLIAQEGPLPGQETISLTHPLEIDIPGIGQMSLKPAAVLDQNDPEVIANDLQALISDLGADSLDHARELYRQRQQAENKESLACQSIAALAPNGTDILRRELDDLSSYEDIDDSQEADDIASLKARVENLEVVENDKSIALEDIRSQHANAVEIVAGLRTELRIAKEQLAAPRPGLLSDEELAQYIEKHKEAQKNSQKIREKLNHLQQTAPDKEALEAELRRLTSARDNAASERERQKNRLHELVGIIRARAEDNAEANLAETRGALEKARAREQRYRFEVQVLTELREHLETARQEARDAYFEPIKKEIIPLLSMLHEDAEIEMDSETMLPTKITRKGMTEDIDVLSGGAAEQIAILTRLAFARLYAQSGRQVPIILDDALVYSDDDRIIQMFTALTRISREQQIIVFSCRTRAFTELGGTRCTINLNSA